MNTRYKLLIEIANLILEKVKQYLSESSALDEETCIWVDWDARCVMIGKATADVAGDLRERGNGSFGHHGCIQRFGRYLRLWTENVGQLAGCQ